MGHIEDRRKKRDGTSREWKDRNRPKARWGGRYIGADGREHTQVFKRRDDAERFVTTAMADIARGLWVDPSDGRRTFRDVAEAWRISQVHRPATAAQVETHLRRHVFPTFADRPIGAVRASEIQAWAKGRAEELQPSTIEVVYRWLAAIFRPAVDDGQIPRSPCRGVRLPKVDRTQVIPPAVEVVRKVEAALPERYRALVPLAAGTGLRRGEAFGLTVDSVDFLRRQLRVDRQLVKVGAGAPTFGPPKTDASRRTVPLPVTVVEALARHLEGFPAGADGPMFTDERGAGISRPRFSDIWRRAITTADAGALKFHDLRHVYASLLIRHGESVKVVQARLGHASATETLDTYSHLWPDSEDRTREAVDAVLGGAGDADHANIAR